MSTEMTPQEREHARSKAVRVLGLSKSQANELTTDQIRMMDEMMRESMKPTSDQEMRFRLVEDLRWKKFPVLDDGFITLVDVMGDDEAVVQAARVSYAKDKRDGAAQESPRQLIRYLMRHRHTTPFEMAEIKILVRVPMDTWRQWIRHRTANVNEYSTRYTEAIDSAQKTKPDEWRLQSGSNKQGSDGFVPAEPSEWRCTQCGERRTQKERPSRGQGSPQYGSYPCRGPERGEDYLQHNWIPQPCGESLSAMEQTIQNQVRQVYKERLKAGVAREQARKDLPLSTYTEAYWKIDLHNMLHFCGLRMDSHAQKEIRDYATTLGEQIIKPLFPIVWEAFEDYRLGAMSLTRLDILMSTMLNDSYHLSEQPMKEISDDLFTAICRTNQLFIDNGWDKDKCRERDECRTKLERLGLL